jgi:hypothetical protein
MKKPHGSQEQRLADWLLSGRKITRLEALIELGIFELSARIKALESKGWVIPRKTVKVTNRFGETLPCKEYELGSAGSMLA